MNSSSRACAAALILGAVCLLPAGAEAAPILSLENLPTDYVPNSTFTFDIVLTGATDLNSYFVDVTLAATGGTAGVDFYFDDTNLVGPTNSRYVFFGNDFFFGGAASTFGGLATISISDAHVDPFTGVSTVAGVSDLIATVTVHTTGNVGALTLEIGATPFLDDPNFSPIPEFGNLVIAPTPPVPAIPEPSSLALCGIGLSLLGWRRLRLKASNSSTQPSPEGSAA